MDHDFDTDARPWRRAVGFVGIAAHLVVGYFYLASGLVVPPLWVLVFLAVWVALLVLCIALLRRHPLWVLLVPLIALALLVGGVTVGEALGGWQA